MGLIVKPQSVVEREVREALEANERTRDPSTYERWREAWRAMPIGTVYTCGECGLEFERLSTEECCVGHGLTDNCCHLYGDRAVAAMVPGGDGSSPG